MCEHSFESLRSFLQFLKKLADYGFWDDSFYLGTCKFKIDHNIWICFSSFQTNSFFGLHLNVIKLILLNVSKKIEEKTLFHSAAKFVKKEDQNISVESYTISVRLGITKVSRNWAPSKVGVHHTMVAMIEKLQKNQCYQLL